MTLCVVRVDDAEYRVDFQGSAHALGVEALPGSPGARPFTLPPWRFADHLAALRAALRAGSQGLALDAEAYAQAVLQSAQPDGAAPSADYALLALWWAAGAGVEPMLADDAGRLAADGLAAQLRPWSAGERARALAACTRGDSPENLEIDAVAYLAAMVDACVVALQPHTRLADLDAAASCHVLHAVLAINRQDAAPLAAGAAGQAAARRLLALCRVLGWPPARVEALPAHEADRLLQWMAAAGAEGPAPAATQPPARRRLADHPDAVVIRIEDD